MSAFTLPIASVRVEMRRLTRSGLLLALTSAFAFFGLSGPALALYMPQLLASATGGGQLTIAAADATPHAALMLFTQSAMQLGLILCVAVVITSLGWDARPGSSIFYRTRVARLSALILPRLAIDVVVAVAAFTLGLVLAVLLTNATIGSVPVELGLRTWIASVTYLVMTMSIGHLVMALARRTATAIASATVLTLLLPLLSYLPGAAPWSPTSLLDIPEVGAPGWGFGALAAVAVTAGCVTAAVVVVRTRTITRDA